MSAVATASGPRAAVLDGTLTLASGATLDGVTVAYETFGALAPTRDNAVLVCHALSGDAHVAASHDGDGRVRPGWWDAMVGPGLAIDTDHSFVVCANVLGGCSGTTGPSSIDAATGAPWGLRFPLVTIEDMVDAQARLLDHLGIDRLAAVVGGSMGGMQALAWATRYPQRVERVVAVATTARLSAQAIAFNEVGRQAILADPSFRDGDYYASEKPHRGLGIARMVGHITYLSDESMRAKFGRRLRDRTSRAFGFVTEFEVESYLAHQGARFVERFDANTYLYMTKAMDYFDWTASLSASGRCMPTFLILSFSSDWLFTTAESLEIVRLLRQRGCAVSFAEIESPYGHDAFLLEPEGQRMFIEPFLAGSGSRRDERRAS